MRITSLIVLASLLAGCSSDSQAPGHPPAPGPTARSTPEDSNGIWKDLKMEDSKVRLSDDEWKKRLTPEQYRVLRQAGTERAGTGKYDKTKTPGTYACAACGQELFVSDAKFDSGCGWPAFFAPIKDALTTHVDYKIGYARIEVRCGRCDSHLGHVFDDGPPPTGQRYCINSVCLLLDEKDQEK